jgi:hypothetical protein
MVVGGRSSCYDVLPIDTAKAAGESIRGRGKSGEYLDVGYRLSECLDTGQGVKPGYMCDELKALADHYVKLHADQARLQAELGQARRLMGRWRLSSFRRQGGG